MLMPAMPPQDMAAMEMVAESGTPFQLRLDAALSPQLRLNILPACDAFTPEVEKHLFVDRRPAELHPANKNSCVTSTC